MLSVFYINVLYVVKNRIFSPGRRINWEMIADNH